MTDFAIVMNEFQDESSSGNINPIDTDYVLKDDYVLSLTYKKLTFVR